MAIGLVWFAQTAQAGIIFNGTFPASSGGPDPDYLIFCDGILVDEVDYAGEVRVLVLLTTDQNGGQHYKVQIKPFGVTGVGRLTGDTYQGVGVTMENDYFQADGSGRNTYINQFGLVSRGTGLKYFMHQVTHVSFDENGDIKVEVELSHITCR